jgi:hypothetical protein
LRPFAIGDRQLIVDERDEDCDRWLGPGSADPSPTACIEVDGHVVGWIDADPSPEWLHPGEVNVGYSVFPARRGSGYAARALRLLAAELSEPSLRRALLVIDVESRLGSGRSGGWRAGASEPPDAGVPDFSRVRTRDQPSRLS